MLKDKIKKYLPISLWKSLSNIKMELDSFNTVVILKLAGSNFKSLKLHVRNKCKEITWLDTLTPEVVFLENESIEIYEPKYNAPQKLIKVNRPNICLYKFNNAKVHSESSHVLLGHSIVMERLPHVLLDYCNYSTGFIKGHDNNFSVYKKRYEPIFIDKAFFLGGNGSWNYYHWTIEIIPKLKYFLSSNISNQDIKIILPTHAKNIKSFSVMLEIILESSFEFVYLSKDQIANVQQLYIITTPSNIVINSKKNISFSMDFLYFDKKSINFLRDAVVSSSQYDIFLKENTSRLKIRKVFLARKENLFRKYNQDEVIGLVAKFGFESIYLEDLSFFEQVYLFQNVDFLIGASGAAWTNLIYVNKGVKAISWLGENVVSFSSYSTLARYYECDLEFLVCDVNNKTNTHSDYNVDLIVLENLLRKLMS